MAASRMGLCECGCGEHAPIAKRNSPQYGWVKGQPKRFIRGHNAAHRGHKHSEETRRRMSETRRGKGGGATRYNWKGGYTDSYGYVLVHVGRDHPMVRSEYPYVRKHRLVMSEMIGRPLAEDEVVHHKDEIHDHNEPDNLWIFPNGSSHKAWHNMLTLGHELRVVMPAVQLAW